MLNGSAVTNRRLSEESSPEGEEVDPHFEPVVTLPEVEVSTNEENEDVIVKSRAKLFRFDTSDSEIPEWKERGTGEVKLLRHKVNNACRVVMRRDKTLKICANHFITPWMELKPSAGSNRAWVWTVPADFADEKPKAECLAIRFATPEIANQWKEKFEEARNIVKTECSLYKEDFKNSNTSEDEDDDDTENDSDSGSEKKDISIKEKNEELVEKDNELVDKEKIVIEKLGDLNVGK